MQLQSIERDFKSEYLFRTCSIAANWVTSLEFKSIRRATLLCHFGQLRNANYGYHFIKGSTLFVNPWMLLLDFFKKAMIEDQRKRCSLILYHGPNFVQNFSTIKSQRKTRKEENAITRSKIVAATGVLSKKIAVYSAVFSKNSGDSWIL